MSMPSQQNSPLGSNQLRQLDAAYRRIIDDTIQRSQHLQSTAVLEQLKQRWIEKTHERLLSGATARESISSAYFQAASSTPLSETTNAPNVPITIQAPLPSGNQVAPDASVYVPKLEGISTKPDLSSPPPAAGITHPNRIQMSKSSSAFARAANVESTSRGFPKVDDPVLSINANLNDPSTDNTLVASSTLSFALKSGRTVGSFSRPRATEAKLKFDLKAAKPPPEEPKANESSADDDDWGETQWETVKNDDPGVGSPDVSPPSSRAPNQADYEAAQMTEGMASTLQDDTGLMPPTADHTYMQEPFSEDALDPNYLPPDPIQTDQKQAGAEDSSSDLENVSDLDDENPCDCTDLIVAQFESVQRPHSRKTSQKGLWRITLRHGILQIGHREVLFNSLAGEFSF